MIKTLSALMLSDIIFSRKTHVVHIVLFSIFVLVTLFYIQHYPFDIVRHPDSSGYEAWSSIRPPFYGAFISLIKSLNLFAYLPHIQFCILLVSTYLLCYEITKISKSLVSGVTVIFMILVNIELVKYVFCLLSEGLYFSLAIMFASLVLRVCRKHLPISYFYLGLCVGLLLITKTISVVFVIASAILFVLCKTKFHLIKYFAFGFFLIIVIATLYSQHTKNQHTSFGKSDAIIYNYVGLSLQAKTASVPAINTESKFPETTKIFREIMSQPQLVLSQMKSMRHQYIFSTSFYDYLLWQRGADMEEAIIKDGRKPNGFGSKEFSLLLFSHNPKGFIADVYRNFWAGWLIWDLQTIKEAHEYNQIIKEFLTHLPKDKKISSLKGLSSWIVVPIRGFFYLSFMIGMLISMYVCIRSIKKQPVSPLQISLCVMFFSLIGYFLIVALFAAGIPRYALAGWALHTTIVMGCWVLFRDIFLVKFKDFQ